jgi:thioredoxin reductase
MTGAERFDTVIISGGRAGLAAGFHLAKRDCSFVTLDANERKHIASRASEGLSRAGGTRGPTEEEVAA